MENVIYTLIILVIWLTLFIGIKFVFKFKIINNSISSIFFKNILLAAVTIWAFVLIIGQFDIAHKIFKTLILSSSLVVAVLGFACQRSLEDLISGIMISIYKPFEVGDRVTLMSQSTSGYIESISFRHTILRTFSNSRLIIPNSVINKEILENSDMADTTISNFVDFPIKNAKDVELAIEIIEDEVNKHPSTLNIVSMLHDRYKTNINEDTTKIIVKTTRIKKKYEEKDKKNKLRKEIKRTKQKKVAINEINKDFINLRVIVWTQNVDDNFVACSDIRRTVLKRFCDENIEI